MKSSSGINIGNGNNSRENRKITRTTSPSSSPSSAYINKRATKTNTTLTKSLNVEQDPIKSEEQQLNDFIQPASSFYTTSTSTFQSESVSSKFQFQITPEALNQLNHYPKTKQRHTRVQWIARHASLHSKTKVPNANTSVIITSSSLNLDPTAMATNSTQELPNVSITEMSRKDFDDQYQKSQNQDDFDQTLKCTSADTITDDDDDDEKEKAFVDQGSQAVLADARAKKKIRSASYHKKIKSATKRPKPPSATQVTQQSAASSSSPTRTASQAEMTAAAVPKLTPVVTKIEDINAGKNCITVDTSKARSNLEVVRLCLRDLGWKEVRTRFLQNPFINSPYL